MSAENEAVVRRAFDEIAQGNLDVADEIIAPEYVRHDLAGGPDAHGPDGVKRPGAESTSTACPAAGYRRRGSWRAASACCGSSARRPAGARPRRPPRPARRARLRAQDGRIGPPPPPGRRPPP